MGFPGQADRAARGPAASCLQGALGNVPPGARQSHEVVPLIAKETTPGVDIADDSPVGIQGGALMLDRDLLQGA